MEFYSEDYLLNYLDFKANTSSDPNDLAFVLESYFLLGVEPPNKEELFNSLNNLQGSDGTWNTEQIHYVPNSAHILMEYKRYGFTPKKSLDPFLSTIDTWDEVNAHVEPYNYPGNYWGGLWGYVNVFVLHMNERPPWASELLNAIETEFDDWAYESHQRTHVAAMLMALSESMPRKEDVLNITLKQQDVEGAWSGISGAAVTETATTIWLLRTFFTSTLEVEIAIEKGLAFIRRNYQEGLYGEEMFAGFSNSIGGRPALISTTMALYAFTGKDWTV